VSFDRFEFPSGCHPERSAAQSKDLQLRFVTSESAVIRQR
jgi:hypothetical protein